MIKQFIKHVLTEKKVIILFYLGIIAFVTKVDFLVIKNLIYYESNFWLWFTLIILNMIVLPAFIYHPYRQWKDGL